MQSQGIFFFSHSQRFLERDQGHFIQYFHFTDKETEVLRVEATQIMSALTLFSIFYILDALAIEALIWSHCPSQG